MSTETTKAHMDQHSQSLDILLRSQAQGHYIGKRPERAPEHWPRIKRRRFNRTTDHIFGPKGGA